MNFLFHIVSEQQGIAFPGGAHLIKSASSELEALIGGAAAEAVFLGPEVA